MNIEWLFYSNQDMQKYAIFFTVGVILFLSLCFFVGLRRRSSKKHAGIHGTAEFATEKQVRATGLVPSGNKPGSGVYVGGFDDESGKTLYLRHNGPEHVCVVAPARSGKGVGLIIPTLLSWPESVFVLDIRGENYAISSGWRQKSANNIVLRFDPAVRGASCSWNAVGEIRFDTSNQISDTQNVALMVVDTDGKGLNDHWKTAAHSLISGVILHALYKSRTVGRTPGLPDCAHLLMGVGDFSPPAEDFDDTEKPLTSLFMEMRNVVLDGPAGLEAQVFIRGVGTRMLNTSDRELTSIISTANNALSLYCDPTIAENTSRNDFKVADLMDAEKPVSLYFISTPDNMQRLKPLMRLLLTRMIMGLTGEMEFDDGRAKTAHKHRLLLMLDEFPTLGRLDIFESALAYIGGYGIKAYLIVQDIQQLFKAYTREESIISNCHILIAFAPNKLETAEWLSRMTGQTTVIKEQISTSGKRFGLMPEQSFTRSYQEVQRPLMTAGEIRELPRAIKDENENIILKPGEMLIFVAGQPVIRGRQILYFMDPTFSSRSKIAPPKISDVVRPSSTQTQDNFAVAS